MRKLILICAFHLPYIAIAQVKSPTIKWIGKSNRISNPGAESNGDLLPLLWKSDFQNWEAHLISGYGVTSHEWNHGQKKGIPANSGNNYFRLTVNQVEETRKFNLFQSISLSDLRNSLQNDTVFADFQFWSGVNYPDKSDCAYAEVKVIFKDMSNKSLDSVYVKRVPGEFRDLDAGTQEAEERGFNVMHEMLLTKKTHQVPKEAHLAVVHMQCVFPCTKFKSEDDVETEGEFSNTFFFDNFSLGFFTIE